MKHFFHIVNLELDFIKKNVLSIFTHLDIRHASHKPVS